MDRTKFEAVHDELRRDENVKSKEELTDPETVFYCYMIST